MKRPLLPLLFSCLLLACQNRQEKLIVNKRQTEDKVEVIPELHRKLVVNNNSIDTATYNQLLDAGFKAEDAKSASYAGCSLHYAEVGNTSLQTQEMTYAVAYIKSDSLIVRISPSSLLSPKLSDHGLAITLVGNKYSLKYFQWSDLDADDSFIDAAYSKLILSSDIFEKGDTLAGKLFYRSAEVNERKKYASGYFRAVIN